MSDNSIIIDRADFPKCPKCDSIELVGGDGYRFCTNCGWDELDDEVVPQ